MNQRICRRRKMLRSESAVLDTMRCARETEPRVATVHERTVAASFCSVYLGHGTQKKCYASDNKYHPTDPSSAQVVHGFMSVSESHVTECEQRNGRCVSVRQLRRHDRSDEYSLFESIIHSETV